MKIIALDIGTVRIGIATSDIMEIIASAYEVYRRKNLDVDVKYIAELVSKLDAGEIVIGLPLKLDGTEGQSVEMAKSFGEKLSELTNVPIVYQDERLSTVSAQRILIESGMRREKRKDKVDSIAATFILQTYLDKKSLKKGSLA
jgi:putative Holliday junction resolvase